MKKSFFTKIWICAIFILLGSALFTVHLEGGRQQILNRLSPASSSAHGFPVPDEFRGVVTSWIYIKADHYFHAKEWDRIVPLLRARATIDPRLTDSWSTGAWHLAFNLSEEVKKNPDSRKKFILQGVQFLEEGIRKNPRVAHLYFDLAWTYFMRLGDLQKASQLFKTSFTIEPNLKNAIWLAYMYEKQGRYEDEMRLWEKYISIFPTDQRGLYRFARAYARSRRYKKEGPELRGSERKTILSKG